MQQSKDKSQAGLTAAENEKIQDLVAETRLARAIKRHLAMNSALEQQTLSDVDQQEAERVA
jgi:hypothetical protein